MTKKEIKETLENGERLTLECKKASGGLPRSVWETYSSFANTQGGTILLGIEEDLKQKKLNKRFTVCGVSNPEQRIKEFWDIVNNENKVSVNLLKDEDVQIIEIDSKPVIYINVPRADYHDRPVFINNNPYGGSFKRKHEGDYHCSRKEVNRMIRDNTDEGSDGQVLKRFGFQHIDLETLHAYRNRFRVVNYEHVWNDLEDLDFLKVLGCYGSDDETGASGLTTAGLLMFGQGVYVNNYFSHIRMDYLDQSNITDDVRWNDRLTFDGRWEYNIYNFFSKVLPKLVSDLKRPFRLEGVVRMDDTPVHKSVREAFVNMFVHADYHSDGLLLVKKTSSSFTFINPGSLRISADKIYHGGYSAARNPKIQAMFRMIGFGDNIGSGFPTILKTWKNENWHQPILSEDEDLNIVKLELDMVSLIPEEFSQELNVKFGEKYDALDSKSQIILSLALSEGEINNSSLQSMLGLNSTEIKRLLNQLLEGGLLIAEGKGRGTKYHLAGSGMSSHNLDSYSVQELILNFLEVNGESSMLDLQLANVHSGTRQNLSRILNEMEKQDLIRKEKRGNKNYYRMP